MRQLLDPIFAILGICILGFGITYAMDRETPAAAQTGTVTRQATGSTLSVAIDPLPINGLKPILVNPLVVTSFPRAILK